MTRYDDVKETANRADVFSSADGAFIPPSGLPRMAPIDYDGDEHHFWRALMQTPVSPPAVRALHDDIVAIVDRHIDAFAANGSANLAKELAEPVPAHVVGMVAGLDVADCGTLREEAIKTFQSIGTPDFADNKNSFDAFVNDQIARRRAEPRDDFLTDLAIGRIGTGTSTTTRSSASSPHSSSEVTTPPLPRWAISSTTSSASPGCGRSSTTAGPGSPP
ncbi:cytochrome P450 [Tsukamurella sp. PLM1]|uniref:cytochrome P450 n=1 Tax=Tsukamurella sp. PLM1 TaxID=2929795 RepID=UPI002048906D|nr:cytochrome P450 [Tsukamurella sp. PLM1]BDH59496.1 hypothetical protein MTP03_44350 [Tsukamurella sp. PLM1]